MGFTDVCSFDPTYAGCLGAEVEYWTTDTQGTGYDIVAPRLFLGEDYPRTPMWPATMTWTDYVGKSPLLVEGRLKPELPAIQIEAITGICHGPSEIERDLIATRSDLERLGQLYGFGICTYPTPRFPFKTEVYPKDRYLAIKSRVPEERLRAGWITGLHGHYGCGSLEEAIRLLNGLRPLIPMFVALSARSPEYMGVRNGYMSERMRMYMMIQPEIMPPYIESVVHLEDLARDRGFDSDPGSCWWGVRINPRHGTVEVRLMDMQETPEHAAQFLALLAVVCRQILSGERGTVRTSADDISQQIDEAARMGTGHLDHRIELERIMRYAEFSGFTMEHRYLLGLLGRLYPCDSICGR